MSCIMTAAAAAAAAAEKHKIAMQYRSELYEIRVEHFGDLLCEPVNSEREREREAF